MIDVTDTGRFHPYWCVTSLQLCKCRADRTWCKQLCSCSIYSSVTVAEASCVCVFVCLSHFLERSIFEILPNFSHTLKEERTDSFFGVKAQHSRGLASCWEIHYILHKFSLRLEEKCNYNLNIRSCCDFCVCLFVCFGVYDHELIWFDQI